MVALWSCVQDGKGSRPPRKARIMTSSARPSAAAVKSSAAAAVTPKGRRSLASASSPHAQPNPVIAHENAAAAVKSSDGMIALQDLAPETRKVAIDMILGDPAVWDSCSEDVRAYVKSVRPEAFQTPPAMLEVASPATVAAVKAKGKGKGKVKEAPAREEATYQSLPVSLIKPEHDRDPGAGEAGSEEEGDTLAALVASIKASGVQTPIRVRVIPEDDGGHVYRIIFGRRRHAAAILAGLKEIPAMVVGAGEGMNDDIDALVENVQRKDLHPFELVTKISAICQQLTAVQVASMTGLGDSYVRKINSVALKCIPRALAALKDGKVTLLDCIKMSPKDPGEQEKILAGLLGEVVAGGAGAGSGGSSAEPTEPKGPTADTISEAIRIWKEGVMQRPGVAAIFGSAIEGVCATLKGKGALDTLERMSTLMDRIEDLVKLAGVDQDVEAAEAPADVAAYVDAGEAPTDYNEDAEDPQ
jgi:ParB/RepB/Spo0J family partition protein